MASSEPPTTPRGTTVVLPSVCVLFFLVLLTVATGGWFLIPLAAVGLILGFAGIHYLLWGWFMEQEVKRHQEDKETDMHAPKGWPLSDSDRYTRF